MKELGSEDVQRPEGQVVQQFKSSQSNQPIPNPDHDRTGQTWSSHRESLKHVSLVTARTSIWKKKQITIERGDPLFAVMQITSAQC